MTGKVLTGCIVAFWLIMLGALIKVEFLPQTPRLNQVPIEEVTQKIFANPAPARLNVYYRDEYIGLCRVAIRHGPSAGARSAPTAQEPAGEYRGQGGIQARCCFRVKLDGRRPLRCAVRSAEVQSHNHDG